MKFGKIYDYRNKEEAKNLIGKEVIVSDYLCKVEKTQCCFRGTLFCVSNTDEMPFEVEFESGAKTKYQFIREIEEDESILMTYRQLAEWLARGNGQYKYFNDRYSFLTTNSTIENKFVEESIRIRPWDSDKWVVPNVDIYERDCKGN